MLPVTVLETIEFFAPGLPKPGGSKTPQLVRRKGGQVVTRISKTGKEYPLIAVRDASKNQDWKASVSFSAIQALADRPPFEGALRLRIIFVMPRPRDHYRANGQVKATAPSLHTKTPDQTKLLRSTEDALTGILWRDDAQIADGMTSKVFTSVLPGLNVIGALITVEQIEFDHAAVQSTHNLMPALNMPCMKGVAP